MGTDKRRHTVWLTDETWEKVGEHYRADSCSTKNEYIEKAVRFYSGYKDTERAGEYLSPLLAETLEGTLGAVTNRMGRLLFKHSVELAIISHLIAADTDVNQSMLDRLRGRCVDDVKRTNGQISFKDILQFQKGE